MGVVLWIAVSAYALFGGADFGGGFWDLTAGNARDGERLRGRIEHSIGPVWEANHVWLIFALVVLWTGFPGGYAAVASTLYIPLTVVALGIILRGSAFAFRKSAHDLRSKRALGATFAAASVLTPFFLGATAGGIASGRVPLGIARGSILTSWVNPTSLLGGVLAVGTCAWLAAIYLTGDAARNAEDDLVEAFRSRALASGVVVGVVALAGIAVLHTDARTLFNGLINRALPLVGLSAVAGGVSLGLLWWRRYGFVRITGAIAVVAVIWGWGAAQYPRLLVGGPTLAAAAAPSATLHAMLWSLLVGGLLVVPSLGYLYVLFNSPSQPGGGKSKGGRVKGST